MIFCVYCRIAPVLQRSKSIAKCQQQQSSSVTCLRVAVSSISSHTVGSESQRAHLSAMEWSAAVGGDGTRKTLRGRGRRGRRSAANKQRRHRRQIGTGQLRVAAPNRPGRALLRAYRPDPTAPVSSSAGGARPAPPWQVEGGGGDLDFPPRGSDKGDGSRAATHPDFVVTSSSPAPHPRCAPELGGSAPPAVGEREQEAAASDGEGQRRERAATPAS
jgi:hypothetical protein